MIAVAFGYMLSVPNYLTSQSRFVGIIYFDCSLMFLSYLIACFEGKNCPGR